MAAAYPGARWHNRGVSDQHAERLRAICLALPEVTERPG